MNRRNYYRVLHVQPDAPAEVVRAAYRALMVKHHPDQGGDHDQAVLLNEAWAVLGDPVRRAAYDEKRARAGHKPRTGAEARGSAAPPPPPRRDTPPASAPNVRTCPFCGGGNPVSELACLRCEVPLTRVRPAAPTAGPSGDDRRRLPRVSRADWGTMKLQWQGDAIDIRLRNLSLEGVSFFSGAPLVPRSRIRLTAAAFDAVVDVIRCERSGNIYVAQGAFVTVRFAAKGGFVYTTA
ncbi:MAG: J domain-containing protein [Gemmatimonadaceae bacterium]|nr:J domain-containing protein [Gemmatimonadaceae bacterium]